MMGQRAPCRTGGDPRWRVIDLWYDTYVVGSTFLGAGPETFRDADRHPPPYLAALVLTGVCAVCLIYLSRRIRAVEIVR